MKRDICNFNSQYDHNSSAFSKFWVLQLDNLKLLETIQQIEATEPLEVSNLTKHNDLCKNEIMVTYKKC